MSAAVAVLRLLAKLGSRVPMRRPDLRTWSSFVSRLTSSDTAFGYAPLRPFRLFVIVASLVVQYAMRLAIAASSPVAEGSTTAAAALPAGSASCDDASIAAAAADDAALLPDEDMVSGERSEGWVEVVEVATARAKDAVAARPPGALLGCGCAQGLLPAWSARGSLLWAVDSP